MKILGIIPSIYIYNSNANISNKFDLCNCFHINSKGRHRESKVIRGILFADGALDVLTHALDGFNGYLVVGFQVILHYGLP